jgi:hypothetical protein
MSIVDKCDEQDIKILEINFSKSELTFFSRFSGRTATISLEEAIEHEQLYLQGKFELINITKAFLRGKCGHQLTVIDNSS